MDLVRIEKNITLAIGILTGLLSLCGCSEELGEPGDGFREDDAITVTAEYPLFTGASGSTRAVSVPEKTAFQNGDAIHLSATFTLQDTPTTTARQTVYNCFVYKDGQWVSTSATGQVPTDEVMKWPWNAISGKFTAYYMPTSNGNLAVGSDKATSCRLDGQYTDCDLLYAETDELSFGHTVNLTFHHLCTRLVLTEVKSGYVDKFGLRIQTPPTGGTDITGTYKQTNTCVLTRNEDNTLSVDFVQKPNSDGSVSVISSANTEQVLVFYLQPGNYFGAEVCYTNNRPYIELNVEGLKECKAGYSYEINVSHTPGVIKKEEDDPWIGPDKDNLTFDINIDAFLQSIEEGKTYSEEDPKTHEPVQITRFDESGHIELLYNLNFKNKQFTPRSLPASCYLHGNYHSIQGISNVLFKDLNGTLDNLELRDVNIDNPSGNQQNIGALAGESHGNVNNVRLNECRIVGYAPMNSTGVLSLGALVGEQSGGVIDNVILMGDIIVEGKNELDNGTSRPECDATVDLGGIVGQTAGTIKNITMLANTEGKVPTLTVSNQVSGSGIVSTGGVTGLSSGTISDCIITCTVNASSCKAQQNSVSGLIGRMRGGSMGNCTVSGSVTGGTTEVSGNLHGYALTGGICGYFVDDPTIDDCYAFCTVAEQNGETSTERVFATGGGIGMINSNSSHIRNCRTIGSVTGMSANTGSFVGLYRGTTGNQLQDNGNQASDTNGHPFCGQYAANEEIQKTNDAHRQIRGL